MSDIELLKQTFDKIGVRYVYHDDRHDPSDRSESLFVADDDVVFWFVDGEFNELSAYVV
jgi:hypothetical protein